MVDVYIALSKFARQKFIDSGIPEERIIVKPNFVSSDPGLGEGTGGYALFVGRLCEEKGLRVLMKAWESLGHIPLKIVGDGPLRELSWPEGATPLGARPHEQVLALMREATVLIFPSIWYECAPMAILEALACGLPVIASNIGSIPEFVHDHRTGCLFSPGHATDLASQVRWAWEHPVELRAMRAAARHEYEQKYTAARGYQMLMGAYALAIERARTQKAT